MSCMGWRPPCVLQVCPSPEGRLAPRKQTHKPDQALSQFVAEQTSNEEQVLRRVMAMVRRRARAAGITIEVCNHTFRDTGITAYLENGGTLEKARQMAAHASTARPSSATAARTASRSMRS